MGGDGGADLPSRKGQNELAVPKRDPGLRRVVEGITGWGLLARQLKRRIARP